MSDSSLVDSPIVQRRMSLRGRIALFSALAVAVAITVTTIAVFRHRQGGAVRTVRQRPPPAHVCRRPDAAGEPGTQFRALSGRARRECRRRAAESDQRLDHVHGGTPPPLPYRTGRCSRNLAHSLRTITGHGETASVSLRLPAGRLGALVIAQPTAHVQNTLERSHRLPDRSSGCSGSLAPGARVIS